MIRFSERLGVEAIYVYLQALNSPPLSQACVLAAIFNNAMQYGSERFFERAA